MLLVSGPTQVRPLVFSEREESAQDEAYGLTNEQMPTPALVQRGNRRVSLRLSRQKFPTGQLCPLRGEPELEGLVSIDHKLVVCRLDVIKFTIVGE